jgi:hypothetical protein
MEILEVITPRKSMISRIKKVAVPLTVAGAMLTLCVVAEPEVGMAATFRGRMMTMPELVKSSDEIVIGVVEKSQGVWRNGRVETDTVIIVQEGLKGNKYSLGPGKKSMDRASAPRVRMTTLGGTPPGSPLTQHVSFSPFFTEEEEVVLFLKYPEADPAKRERAMAAAPDSKLITSPRITGYFQGKFSVFTDEASGQKRVARLNLDAFDVLPSDASHRAALRALATNRLGVTSGPLVAKSPEDAPSLGSLTVASRQAKSAATGALFGQGKTTKLNPIPVSPLEDFVNQIKESAR